MTWAPANVPAGTWTQSGNVRSIQSADTDIIVTPAVLTNTGTVGLSTTGVAAGTYGDSTHTPQIQIDAKGRILVATSVAIAGGGGGSGTVTTLSVASANGFAGTVATPTTTPVITLQATPVGLLKSDGTGISSATPATDYVAPGRATSSGITMATARLLGRTSGSTGAVEELAIGGILTFTAGVLSTSPVGGSGTVTSVDASGGGTGLSFTGGPITGAGVLTATGTLLISHGGTSTTTSTGTGSLVLANSPNLVTPGLGTPSQIVLTNGTGLSLTTGVTGVLTTGSGGTNTTASTGTGANVLANSPTLITPNIGTVSGGVLTSATGLPLSTGVAGILTGSNGGTGINNAARTITIAGNLVQTGAFTTTIAAVATATYTLPGATDTLAGITSTQTLSNKTLTAPAITSASLGTSSATLLSSDAFIVSANNVINTTTNALTLLNSHNGTTIYMNTTVINTVSVNTGLTAGFACTIVQLGAGTTAIATASTAVTLNSYSSQLKLLGQYAAATLMARGTNTYIAAGMLTT